MFLRSVVQDVIRNLTIICHRYSPHSSRTILYYYGADRRVPRALATDLSTVDAMTGVKTRGIHVTGRVTLLVVCLNEIGRRGGLAGNKGRAPFLSDFFLKKLGKSIRWAAGVVGSPPACSEMHGEVATPPNDTGVQV